MVRMCEASSIHESQQCIDLRNTCIELLSLKSKQYIIEECRTGEHPNGHIAHLATIYIFEA